MIKRFLLPLVFCTLLTLAAFANEAADISGDVTVTLENISRSALFDGKIKSAATGENVKITIESEMPLGGIWIRFSAAPEGAMLDGESIMPNGFWSEYIDLGGKTSATLTFDKISICDLRIYSVGELPSEVQRWEVAQYETDIMLFASHSDDDQLFFAGLLPYYVAKGNVDVKVCFFTTSYQDISRVQELLAGLWHCGVKNYPIIFPLPDDYSESFDGARKLLEKQGYTYDSVKAMVTDVLNTYKPLVVVLHDFKGEYGHGMHIFATSTIVDAIESAANGDFVPSKVYVHLYAQNEILLPIDEPLEYFENKTAFNVSQEAFQNHKSQHWTWFYDWIYGKNKEITKSSQIKYCCPAKYGLYFSSVGADTGNDMLENIETYAQKYERIAKEEAERLAAIEATRVVETTSQPIATSAVTTATAEPFAKAEETPMSVAHFLPLIAAAIITTFTVAIIITKKNAKH